MSPEREKLIFHFAFIAFPRDDFTPFAACDEWERKCRKKAANNKTHTRECEWGKSKSKSIYVERTLYLLHTKPLRNALHYKTGNQGIYVPICDTLSLLW